LDPAFGRREAGNRSFCVQPRQDPYPHRIGHWLVRLLAQQCVCPRQLHFGRVAICAVGTVRQQIHCLRRVQLAVEFSLHQQDHPAPAGWAFFFSHAHGFCPCSAAVRTSI
jgi:hypothetical protein